MFKVDYDIKVSYSNYVWCYTNQKYININSNVNFKKMIKLNLKSNFNADYVRIYDNSKSLLRIPFNKDLNIHIPFYSSDIRVSFEKYRGFSILSVLCSKTDYVSIYSLNIPVPEINFDSYISHECSVCIEKIDMDNIYITQCQHLFCNKCIWQYFYFNKNIQEKPCAMLCEHTQYIHQFICPVCRTLNDVS